MTQNHERFMRMSLEEAERIGAAGNVAVGSVIVKGDTVVARGGNLTTSNQDPTAHAETVALREAGRAVGVDGLSECTLYTTFQPCPMCAGAILVSGIPEVVLGARPDPAERRFGPYTLEDFLQWTGWQDRVSVVTGILVEECAEVRRKWEG